MSMTKQRVLIYSGLLPPMFREHDPEQSKQKKTEGTSPSATSSFNLKIKLGEHRPGHLSLAKSEFELTRKNPVILRTLMKEKFKTNIWNFQSVLITLRAKQKGDNRSDQTRSKDYRPWVDDLSYYFKNKHKYQKDSCKRWEIFINFLMPILNYRARKIPSIRT